MRSELAIHFDYGSIVPWGTRIEDAMVAVAGPDALSFRTPVDTQGENLTTVSESVLRQAERVPFVLTWFPSHEHRPDAIDPLQALDDAEDYWLNAGYNDEAIRWRNWLLRAVAGSPQDVQIMYGIGGERRLEERETDWFAGLRGLTTGTGRERGLRAAPARRLRRGGRRAVPDPVTRRCTRRQRLGAGEDAAQLARRRVAAGGLGDLGGARSAPPLHALQADGLGRVRPCRPRPRRVRPRGARRALEGAAGRDPRQGAGEVVVRGKAGIHTVVRLGPARRLRPLDAAHRLPARRRPAHGLHHRRDPSRAFLRRAVAPLLARRQCGRRAAAR